MEKQYIVSERAHLMCPNMQFGILCTLPAKYQAEKMQAVIDQLRAAHPFLSCLIEEENDGRYFYSYHKEIKIHPILLESRKHLEEDYKNATSNGWNIIKEPLWRVYIYPEGDSVSVLLMVHHLLCDGRGLLGLTEELADCYIKGIKPKYVEEKLITSLDDLPRGSDLPFLSKMIVNSCNKNWEKEQHKVDYSEYVSFEQNYFTENKCHMTIETTLGEDMNQLMKQCKSNHISVNDYLIADLMQKEHAKKVVIAADIRNELTCYRKGSMGNYATAFSVVCKSKSKDVITLAKNVSAQVRKIRNTPNKVFLILACYFHMIPELLDAVAITSLGTYQSKAGKFVGDRMFGYKERNGYCISNLGKIETDSIKEAVFLPPMSPANYMIQGVLTVNGTMKICTVRRVVE